MSATALEWIGAFDALPDTDRDAVVAELLRRPVGAGDLADSALEELADELFSAYDADEDSDAAPSR